MDHPVVFPRPTSSTFVSAHDGHAGDAAASAPGTDGTEAQAASRTVIFRTTICTGDAFATSSAAAGSDPGRATASLSLFSLDTASASSSPGTGRSTHHAGQVTSTYRFKRRSQEDTQDGRSQAGGTVSACPRDAVSTAAFSFCHRPSTPPSSFATATSPANGLAATSCRTSSAMEAAPPVTLRISIDRSTIDRRSRASVSVRPARPGRLNHSLTYDPSGPCHGASPAPAFRNTQTQGRESIDNPTPSPDGPAVLTYASDASDASSTSAASSETASIINIANHAS